MLTIGLYNTALAFITVKDDAYQIIKISKPAARIISLAPDLTEIIFAIGAGDKLVGVVSGCDYPSAAKQLPIVGSYSGIDLERIIALHPDLILTWGDSFIRQLSALKQFNIAIYKTKPRYLADVPRTMINLGRLTGRELEANKVAHHFLSRLEALREKPLGIRVFYQVGDYVRYTINKESWINQVIELCGGRNVFAEAKIIAPRVDDEAVIAANPQVIVADTKQKNWKAHWQTWPQIAAVRKNLLFNIEADWIDRAGPRLLLGTEKMCAILGQVLLYSNSSGSGSGVRPEPLSL